MQYEYLPISQYPLRILRKPITLMLVTRAHSNIYFKNRLRLHICQLLRYYFFSSLVYFFQYMRAQKRDSSQSQKNCNTVLTYSIAKMVVCWLFTSHQREQNILSVYLMSLKLADSKAQAGSFHT